METLWQPRGRSQIGVNHQSPCGAMPILPKFCVNGAGCVCLCTSALAKASRSWHCSYPVVLAVLWARRAADDTPAVETCRLWSCNACSRRASLLMAEGYSWPSPRRSS